MNGRSGRSQAMPASHQDSYLVSVGDLMAGLVLVLMVLLMTFAFQVFKASQWIRQEQVRLTEADATRRKVLAEISQALKNSGVNVIIDLDKGLLRLPEEVLFDSGKAAIQPRGWRAISLLAHELELTLPKCVSLEAVLIEGHSDNQPILGSAREGRSVYFDNWDLSFARAKNTHQALQIASKAVGTMLNRHGIPILGMAAYADSRPVFDNATPAGQAGNRRIDIRLVLEAPSAKE